jgi:hypothetical protein
MMWKSGMEKILTLLAEKKPIENAVFENNVF